MKLLAALVLVQWAAGADISYILLDARSGAVISRDWPDAERAVPLGSLVKPFTALAYAETHGFRYPEFECTGNSGGCWFPRGHGRLGIREAVAWSCNAYFFKLAAAVRLEDVAYVADRFAIAGPGPASPRQALIGLGNGWEMSPLGLARAYSELALRAGAPGIDELLEGMALSAASGTGNEVRADALVKTGTAPCTHARKLPGDGFTMMLYPRESPSLALLVRVHGVTGAQAAATAGQILRACHSIR